MRPSTVDLSKKHHDEHDNISTTCQIWRHIGLTIFSLQLVAFAIALIMRTGTLWSLMAPTSVGIGLLVAFVYLNYRRKEQ
jgi:integral membrane sensor domain MASE1